MKKYKLRRRHRCGFTVIELFVVAVVVVVLAVLTTPRLAQMVERRRVSQVVTRFDAIKKAEAMHYSLHGAYTASMAAMAVEVPEVDDGIIEENDGQWVYDVTVAGGISPSYTVTATRMAGKGMPGSIVWDSSAGNWRGTHPLRPR